MEANSLREQSIYRTLRKKFSANRGCLAGILATLAAETAISLLLPGFVSSIINGLDRSSMARLMLLTVLFLLTVLISGLFYAEKCRERSKSEIKDRVLDRLVGVASSHSSNLALGTILLIALPFMVSGEFTVGDLVMFEYYYAFLTDLPDAIAGLAKRRKQTKVSLERLGFLLEERQECHGTVTERDGLRIELEIDGQAKAIQAKQGDVVAIRDKDGGRLLRELFLLC